MSEISKRDLDQYKKIAKLSCDLWGLDSKNIELVCNGENVTYKIISSGKKYCLRVTDETHRSEGQIISELDWILYLSNNNVGAAKPLELPSKAYYKKYIRDEKTYFSSIFEWAKGDFFNSEKHLNKKFIQSLGAYVGRMNALTKKYNNSHLKEKRKLWEDSRHNINASNLIEKSNPKLVAPWCEAREWYNSLEKSVDTYGLCHIDLHTGNFHIDDQNQITAFDFDDSAYCFFTYDIIIPLMRLQPSQTDDFSYEKIEEFFFEGYLKENSLDQVWIDRIPSFIRLRNIELYAWIEFMFGQNKKEKQIEYQKRVASEALKKHSFI